VNQFIDGDLWIEVGASGFPPGVKSTGSATLKYQVSSHVGGSSGGYAVTQMNLTAYIRELISSAGTSECSPSEFNDTIRAFMADHKS
jgi:hypothetical protein